MAEKKVSKLALELDDSGKALWDALGGVEQEEPSPGLRRSFHAKLEHASRRSWLDNLRDFLGLRSNTGWLTSAACLLVGLVIGQVSFVGSGDDGARLAALEESITALNRRLILDRLDDTTPSTRLRGVMDAASVAAGDAEIASALLVRATQDRVPSVRSAAIDALASSTKAPAIGEQIMSLLEQAESPIVQFALVDLVLRYGNAAQIDQLVNLAEQDRLHPDLQRHVYASVKGDTA
ncbi:MAG: hypothetical protein L0Y45_09600 [Woeseiaceae bacterium]|nr:hypothetical protein [Woeseiaceae bacterium]